LSRTICWRGRAAGSGLPFHLIARSTQPTALTKPVEAGSTLQLMVQAVNGGSQSVPSDSIIFTVPSAAKPAAAILAPAADAIPATANGNGNGSGSDGILSGSRLS